MTSANTLQRIKKTRDTRDRNSDFGDPNIRPNPNPNPITSTFAFVFVLITAWDSDSYLDSFKRMDDSEGALPPREEGFEEQHPTSKRARLEDEPEAAAEAAFEQSSDEDSITSEGNGDESNTDKGSGDDGSVVEVNELKLKPSQ